MTQQDRVNITGRFFAAIDELKARKTIRGLATFTNRYNINRWNLINVRDNPANTILRPEYIAYLVEGYNVSAEWILLGKGQMFKTQTVFKIVKAEE